MGSRFEAPACAKPLRRRQAKSEWVSGYQEIRMENTRHQDIRIGQRMKDC
jgi:hypothetical protein